MSPELVDVALEAATAASAVLAQGLERQLDVREKGADRSSIVTWADLRSQEAIVGVIERAFPDHVIRGEEGNAGAGAGAVSWYVDPVDGTTNYSHGLPYYCVSIAAADTDGIAAGVILDPVRNDIFVATRDGDATHNGERMQVSATAELRSALMSTQVQSDDPEMWERYLDRARALLGVGRAVRSLGSPALAMAYVARGWLDCFCEESMAPWDTLAGTLLVERAGGVVTDFEGSGRPVDGTTDVLASNRLLHDDFASLLSPGTAPKEIE